MVNASGFVSTIVGGLGLTTSTSGTYDGYGPTQALVGAVYSLAIDAKGILWMVDYTWDRIKTVNLTSLQTATVSGGMGFNFIGGNCTSGNLASPYINWPNTAQWPSTCGTSLQVTYGLASGPGIYSLYNYPAAIAFNPLDGLPYIADQTNFIVRKLKPNATSGLYTPSIYVGDPNTYAGGSGGGNSALSVAGGFADGVGTNALFFSPVGMVFDSKGAMFVADLGNNAIRKILPDGTVSTFVGAGPDQLGYNDGTGTNARLQQPAGLAIDASDNIYFTEIVSSRIRKATPAGVVTTIVGGLNNLTRMPPQLGWYGVQNSINSGSCSAWTVPQVQAGLAPSECYVSGSTVLYANSSQVWLDYPWGIALDATRGVLYSSDGYGASSANNVRVINLATGFTEFLAGGVGAGVVDGVGTTAMFRAPSGLVLDKAGDRLFVSDTGNNKIRVIALSTRVVSTWAGGGDPVTVGNTGTESGWLDGRGTAALFNQPYGLAFEASTQNIYVAASTPHPRPLPHPQPLLTLTSTSLFSGLRQQQDQAHRQIGLRLDAGRQRRHRHWQRRGDVCEPLRPARGRARPLRHHLRQRVRHGPHPVPLGVPGRPPGLRQQVAPRRDRARRRRCARVAARVH